MRSREPLSHSSANSLAICAAATVAKMLAIKGPPALAAVASKGKTKAS
jgi:hypothetical protein